MANQNYSRSRTDAPLTREEFFGSQPRQNGSYQYRVRTEGSLAAQPEPVYVPRKRRRPPETVEQRRRSSSSGHDVSTARPQKRRSDDSRELERRGERTTRPATEQERRREQRVARPASEQQRRPQQRTSRPMTEQERREQQRRREIARRRRELEKRREMEQNSETERVNAAELINARRAQETEEERRLHIEQERQQRLAEREMKQKKEKSDQPAASRIPIGSKFGFLLSTAIILLGAMLIVLSYVRIYNKNSEIAALKRELNAVQETNKVAQQKQAETMNMNELYTYAVDMLGMVDADVDTTITVTVVNQSYTTSNLPVSEIGESKVRYHWWFK